MPFLRHKDGQTGTTLNLARCKQDRKAKWCEKRYMMTSQTCTLQICKKVWRTDGWTEKPFCKMLLASKVMGFRRKKIRPRSFLMRQASSKRDCLSVCVSVRLCVCHTFFTYLQSAHLWRHHVSLVASLSLAVLFSNEWSSFLVNVVCKRKLHKKKPSHCSVREVYLSWLTLARFEYTCNFLLEFLRN